MKIIVDAFGGDNAPLEILKGSAQAVAEYGVNITLVGNKETIEKVSSENNILLYHINIVDAESVIGMEDDPSEIMKSKNNSSMARGLKLLANGEGDAFVSAGNSGALVMGATFIVKRVKGIRRCAFAPIMPRKDGFFMLIDGGANVECRPEMLSQFATMGSLYMNRALGVVKPKVGLVNVGVEEHKGGTFQHEVYSKLKQNSNINFIGNIEARDIPTKDIDVIVTDGFTGNVILKLYEGVAKFILGEIKDILCKNLKTKLAGMLLLNDLKEFKSAMNYKEYGGAPILGLTKPVFKAHGNSNANTFKNAIKQTIDYINGNISTALKDALNAAADVPV